MSTVHRIFIADDHPIILNGVRQLLEQEPDIEVVGVACNGDDARRHVIRLQPDLLILDLKMPGRAPLAIVESVHERTPDTKILILSAFDDREHTRKLRDAGIDGYILKDEAPDMLMNAVRSVLQGAAWFSRSILETLIALEREVRTHVSVWASLTEREQAILNAIGNGLTNREIAGELHLAEQTVRNYTSQLYDKLGLQSRAQAVIWTQAHKRPAG